MPPFRNFLARKPAAPNGPETQNGEENNRLSADNQRPGPLGIRKSHESEANEFKLSVNDSGVYLPPSPPEKQSFWRKYPGSNGSSNHRSLVDENEPFSISRESFDSYRRSFDISARSPISYADTMPSRTSLDSRFSHLTPPSTARDKGFERAEVMEEEKFEDVGLNDEAKPKKKGIFARFGDSSSNAQASGSPRSSSSQFGFHIPGRKRVQSGAGSELGAINPEPPAVNSETK